MALFKEGDKVLHIDSKEQGFIVTVKPPRRGGHQNYIVSWGNRQELEQECDLQPDCDISDPFERCQNLIFGSYLDFSRRNTTYKIKNSNNSTISSLKASKTLFRAYQFKPLMKFLNSPNHRLLIADEVGLGKTIEAGHIMLELKARKQLGNVLVICPISLQKKWQEELREKFALNFTVYEDVATLIEDLRTKPSTVKAIINYEKIRVKKPNSGAKKVDNSLVQFIMEQNTKFGLILCDEAHRLRNKTTLQYQGAEMIIPSADSAVFLTATPVMLNTENLYNLLHLLDNEKYSEYQVFDNLLRENTPFVHALTELNEGVPMKKIATKLRNSEVAQIYYINERAYNLGASTVEKRFGSFPLYQRIMHRMTEENDTNALRAKVQFDLSNMSVMNNIFSRTRKREVTTDLSLATRKPHPRIIKLTDEEQSEYDNVIEEYYEQNSREDFNGDKNLFQGAALGLIQKKRQIASSVYAYLNSEDSLNNGIDEFSSYEDSKVEELKEIISEVFANGNKKLIIFTLFHKTLKYLEIRLKSLGYGCVSIYGPTKNRYEVLKEFKTNPKINILLSTEVGSEGLDMQFCNSMVNYDLPWNPMVVEQRIGRIDRFGQKSPTVNIYNLIVKGSIQEDIYERLLDRIGIFRGSIGDMEAILDAEVEREGRGTRTVQQLYDSMEKTLYCSKLTEEERKKRIAEVERAIENVKEETRRLEKELTNSLTNDSYFRNEIDRILRNNSYVTEVEIKNYLTMIIREHLTTCDLKSVGDDKYEIIVPKSNSRILHNFLTANQPRGEENEIAFRQFKTSMDEMKHLYVTFNQNVAFENRDIIYLNIYHPIIIACLNYFLKAENEDQKTFSFPVYEDDIIKAGESFLMGVYQLTTTRDVHGSSVKSETLLPFVYALQSHELLDSQEKIDHIYGLTQTAGLQKEVKYDELTEDVIGEMSDLFVAAISKEKKHQKEELTLQIDNEKQQNVIQTKAYYESRRKSFKNILQENKDKLHLAEMMADEKAIKDAIFQINTNTGRLQKLDKDEAERISIIENVPAPNISSKLISISFIKVICSGQ